MLTGHERKKDINTSTVLIAGIGNPIRRDDGAGHLVIDLLISRESKTKPNRKIYSPGETPATSGHLKKYGDNLIDLVSELEDSEILVMIDAVLSGSPAGTMRCFNLISGIPESENLRFSSHALSPLQVVEIARNLNRLPEAVFLLTIEGKDFGYGNEISPEVAGAAKNLASFISEIGLNKNFNVNQFDLLSPGYFGRGLAALGADKTDASRPEIS